MLRANRHMKQYRAVEGMYNLDMSEFALVGVSFFLFAMSDQLPPIITCINYIVRSLSGFLR